VRRYLVVGNQTLGGSHLTAVLREIAASPSSFFLLVPATPPAGHSWSDGEAHAAAERRLEEALSAFRDHGLQIEGGEVGDGRPLQAVTDLLDRSESFDEIVVSTLPPGPSRWLKLDLPHRLEAFGMPVRHVVGPSHPAVV
jgi:hypothetical protein